MAKKAKRKTSPISTLAVGEETVFSTAPIGEETTQIAGENHPTTLVIGEETTQIAGEATTLRFGEEHLTTLRYGEEGVIHTTLLLGEEGHGVGPISDLVAELLPDWHIYENPDPTIVTRTAAARGAARKRRR
jgi:hypothetical protein